MIRFLLALGAFLAYLHEGFWGALIGAIGLWVILTVLKWLIGLIISAGWLVGFGIYKGSQKIKEKKNGKNNR